MRKLRGRLMPPPGGTQPEQREIDTFVDVDGSAGSTPPPARGSGRRPRARAADDAHRVRHRGQRPAGRRARRQGTAAGGDRGQRLREHRHGAQRVARVPRPVRRRGAARREARGRRAGAEGVERALREGEGRRPGGAHRRPAPRHARRHEVPPHVSRRRRVPLHVPGPRRGPLHARRRDEHTLRPSDDGREVFRESLGGPEDMGRWIAAARRAAPR